MNHIEFASGSRLTLKGQSLIIKGRGPDGRIKLHDPKNKTQRYTSEEKLRDYICEGVATVVPPNDLPTLVGVQVEPKTISADLSAMSEAVQVQVQRSQAYVKAVLAKLDRFGPTGVGEVIEEVAKSIGDQDPPNWRTVVRWKDKFLAHGLVGLVHEHRGNSHSRIDYAVEELIDRAFTEHWLTPKRPNLKSSYRYLCGLIAESNQERDENEQLTIPSYQTMRNWAAELDRFDVLCARFGRTYAVNWFRTHGMGPVATRPLQMVMIDHTVLDVEVAYGGVLRLGRPTFTIARDKYTGALVGMHIGFDPPSYLSVMECLKTVISGKSALTRDCNNLKHEWTMSGVPEILIVDNGKEFTGNDLKNTAAHLEFDIQYCPPRKPWFKPQVERLFGVLKQQLLSRVHGRTFTIKEERGSERVDDAPVLDIEEIRQVIVKWAVDVFHETPYHATGLPPRIAWEQGIKSVPPRKHFSEDEVSVYLGRSDKRVLQSYGIEFYGLIYASDALSLLRHQLEVHRHHITRNGKRKSKVEREQEKKEGKTNRKQPDNKLLIKYDPTDLLRMWVLDPIANTYIEARAIRAEYADGLSLHRHRLNLQLARERVKGHVDDLALLMADREIDHMIDDMGVTSAERLGKAFARARRKSDDRDPENGGFTEADDADHTSMVERLSNTAAPADPLAPSSVDDEDDEIAARVKRWKDSKEGTP